jgi:hypothetical protein
MADEPCCSKCSKKAERANQILACFLCLKNLHLKCDSRYVPGTRVDESTTVKLANMGYNWICEDCIVTSSRTIDSLLRLESAMGELCAKVTEMEKQLSFLSSKERVSMAKDDGESFASVLKRRNENVIVITANDENNEINRGLVLEKIENSINPEDARISGLKGLSNNKVILKSKTDDVDKLLSEVRENLGADYVVNVVDKKKPKLKVVGIEWDGEISSDRLVGAMRAQNSFVKGSDSIRVIKTYASTKIKDCFSAIVEVDVHLHKLFLKERFMNVRWSRCRVFDATEVPRCFKCARYGHYENSCKSDICCPRCSEAHRIVECKCSDNNVKCINCVEANRKYKLKLNVNHIAGDKKCDTMMRLLKRKIKNINKQ